MNVKQVLVTKLNSTKNSKIDTILNEGINTDLDAMYDGNSNNHNNESRLIRISINNTSSLSLIPNSRPINQKYFEKFSFLKCFFSERGTEGDEIFWFSDRL